MDWVKSGGLPFLFLLVFLEGNPIIGSFIPGQVIVIFVGFLISTNNLFNLYYTLIFVFIGAFLGDIVGFFMGRRMGISGLKVVGLDSESKIYQSSYRFFKRYGAWSIVMGREFNLTRAFMPFFAGSFGMNIFKFLLFSFMSCLIWTLVSVGLGYYFGFVIVANFSFIMQFILFLIIYVVLIQFAYKNSKVFYAENKYIFTKYAMHNMLFMGFFFSIFVLSIFVFKWNWHLIFNDYFSILYFSSLYYFKFLFLKSVFMLLSLFIFLAFLYKREFKLAVVFAWSLVIMFFLSFLIFVFLKVRYDFVPYISIIFYILLVFYLWILLRVSVKNLKVYYFLNKILMVYMIFILFVKFSISVDFYNVFLSFVIGVLITEFVLILSHYRILDSVLSEKRFAPVRGYWRGIFFKKDGVVLVDDKGSGEKISYDEVEKGEIYQNVFIRYLRKKKLGSLKKKRKKKELNNKNEEKKVKESKKNLRRKAR